MDENGVAVRDMRSPECELFNVSCNWKPSIEHLLSRGKVFAWRFCITGW